MLFTVPRSGDGLRLILDVWLPLLRHGDCKRMGLCLWCTLGSRRKCGCKSGERDLGRMLFIRDSCKGRRESLTGDSWVLGGSLLTDGFLFGECDCLLWLPYGDGDLCLPPGESEYLLAADEVLWLSGCLGGDHGDNLRPPGTCLGGSLLYGEWDRRLRKEGDLDTRRLGDRGDPLWKTLLLEGDLPLDTNLSGLRDNEWE